MTERKVLLPPGPKPRKNDERTAQVPPARVDALEVHVAEIPKHSNDPDWCQRHVHKPVLPPPWRNVIAASANLHVVTHPDGKVVISVRSKEVEREREAAPETRISTLLLQTEDEPVFVFEEELPYGTQDRVQGNSVFIRTKRSGTAPNQQPRRIGGRKS